MQKQILEIFQLAHLGYKASQKCSSFCDHVGKARMNGLGFPPN